MNPNIMGMQGLPNVPTTKELWKNEKDKYRIWIVMLTITLTAITVLALVSFILGLINSESIESTIKTSLRDNVPSKITDPGKISEWKDEVTNSLLVRSFKVFPGIIFGLLLIGMVMYIATLIESYKRKSFSKLSKWTTLVIGVGAIYGIYMLISMIQSKSIILEIQPEGIILFMLYVSSILVFLGGSFQVSRIRKQFAISERVEQIKASPQYQAMKAQMDQMQANGGPMMNPMGPTGMGPMGPMSTPQPPMSTKPTNAGQTTMGSQPSVVQPAVKKELTPLEKQTKKLSVMKVDDLRSLAKKLSISGYSTMKKSELVDNIIRITEGK